MKNNDKIIEGKNGLRNYNFKSVKREERKYNQFFQSTYQGFVSFIYAKQCLYCKKEFEGKRIDATFCCQACQKAHLRTRKKH
ncbi:hypothetical protein GCM10027592_47000 [Spirosoma flavus]